MTEYFEKAEFVSAKRQRNKALAVYLVALGIYALVSVAFFVYFKTLPYHGYGDTAKKLSVMKAAHYSITVLFILYSFIYLGIKYKRVDRYYKVCLHIETGIKEQSSGSFLEYDESLQNKDGVDFKALVFLEWNKFKNDFFERKVLVFFEKPFPDIPKQANVSYITQGNVLVAYEIIT